MSDSKNKNLFVGALAIVVIFAALFYMDVFTPEYKFVYEEEYAVFRSNDADPVDLIKSFKDKERFIVIVEIHAPQGASDLIAGSFINFGAIAVGNGKQTILLEQTFEDDVLQGCATNRGDVFTVDELSASACLDYIGDFSKDSTVWVTFAKPDSALSKVNVVVSSNSVDIIVQDPVQAPAFGWFFSEAVFGNTSEVMQNISDLQRRFSESGFGQ